MRVLLLLLLLGGLAAPCRGQTPYVPTPEWAAVGGGAGSNRGHDLVSTGAGVVTVIGAFEGDVGFGPLVLRAAGAQEGHQDVFVTQYDTDGAPRWARRIAMADRDVEPGGIASGADGDLFVSGTFDTSVRLEGGAAPAIRLTAAGGRDAFLARYTSDGDLVWAQAMGGPGDDAGHRLAVHTEYAEPDVVLLVGAFEETAQWGTGEAAQTATSAGGTDGFLARFEADGTLRSLLPLGGPEDDTAEGVSAQQYGAEVAVAGSFRGTALLADTTLLSRGGSDAFALHLDDGNARLNLLHLGGPGNDVGRAVGLSDNFSLFGPFVMAGAFEDRVQVGGNLLVSAGQTDIFLVGLTRTALRGGGPGADEGLDLAYVYGSFGDYAARIPVVTGFINGEVTFDVLEPYFDQQIALAGHGGQDGFVLSFDYDVYALASLGGSGDDTAWGVGAPLPYGWAFGHGLLTGTFETRATLGLMSIDGVARSDVFVADYPPGELAPNDVGPEPGPSAGRLAVSAFPNPARQSVTLLLDLGAEAEVVVEIVDVLGRRVAVVYEGRLPAGETRWRAPVSGLTPGAYGVLVTGGVTAAGRFAVAR